MSRKSILSTILITGASHGLGFELVKVSLTTGNRVFAICRNVFANAKLKTLMKEHPETLSILEGDVSDSVQLQNILDKVKEVVSHIDVLINNAAVLQKNESVFTLKKNQLLESFEVNAVAPLEIVKLSLDLLKESDNPKILNISSTSGVISRVKSFHSLYSYKASKAALNMLTRVLAMELQEEGIPVVAVDPGWMKTDMGGEDATGSPEESAAGIVQILKNLSIEQTGRFLKYDGTKLVW